MEFTDRMVKGEDGKYRWYYDVRYGQDDTFKKVMAIVLGSCGVLFLLLVLLAPEGKMSKWEDGAIMLGVLLFTALLGWIINKVMYMRRGGKYRTRYELDTETLRVLYDSGSSSAMRKMGGVVAAAGVLAGDIGGALTGAGMAGAGQGAELKLKQIRSITLRPGQDYIMIHTLVQHAPVYVPKEDFETLKELIAANADPALTVKKR